MNVLFVHTPADLYGSSRSLLRLASRLVRDGHAVSVVVDAEGRLVQELRRHGVAAIVDPGLPVLARSGFGRPAAVLRLFARLVSASLRLRRAIRRDGVQLVHTNNAAVFLASGLAAHLAGVPHVWHMRESFADFPRLWPFYRRAIVALSTVVMCVSKAVADQFPNAPPGKVRVLPNGFPRAEFEPVPRRRVEAFRLEYGLGDGPAVAVVGRIKMGRKGQETFVQAAALLKDRYPAARFLLIGSPFPGNEAHLSEILRLAESAGAGGRVIYTGEAEDIKAAYAALDVVVVSSGQPEPFAGVTIEAMAMGKPVVGTRIGGTPEQVDDGVTGLLVAPNDPRAMAEAIGRLLQDEGLRRRMGEAGRRRYEARFEFEPFYAQMQDVYRQVLGVTATGAPRA